MIAAAMKAMSQIFAPEFRGVLLRSVGLTLALLALAWAALYASLDWLVDLSSYGFGLDSAWNWVAGLVLMVGLGFLIAPVTSLFAGLFLDEIAEAVEKAYYPADRPGEAMPIGRSIASALRFTVVVVGVNILVLLLVLLPGINVMAFFVANAYLLGREYFEACASRFHDRETVAALRSAHMTRIFLAGLVVTTVLAIPIVNLLTPLFATAFMMHIFKDVDRQRLLVHA